MEIFKLAVAILGMTFAAYFLGLILGTGLGLILITAQH